MSGVCFCRLRAQMALRGFSRRALAAEIGLPYDAICRKMSGRRPFSLREAALIKRALGFEGALETLFELDDTEHGGENA